MKKRFLPATCLLIFAIAHPISSQVFVKHNASGTNNGISWANAYTDLKAALSTAPAGSQIWVAAGIYKPDGMNGDPASTFLINKNLQLLGGFAGNETSAGQRDPEVNETILSGDLNGDDVDDDFVMNKGDNVMTVVTVGSDITNSTQIDGFTIRSGHSIDSNNNPEKNGGGLYSDGAPVIRNCKFTQNHAFAAGGGLYQNSHTGQSIIIEGSIFEKNVANFGGGMHIFRSPYSITDCSFINNRNVSSVGTGQGGGVRVVDGNGYIQNCLFELNTANKNGGAIDSGVNDGFSGTSMQIKDCIFKNNNSLGSSGAVGLNTGSNNTTYTVSGCDFQNNESVTAFGAMGLFSSQSSENAEFAIDGCVFSQNSAGFGGSGMGCNISGNNTFLTLKNTSFYENQAGLHGAVSIFGLSTGNGNTAIDSCHFEKNSSAYGGALELSSRDNSNLDFSVRNTTLIHNDAEEGGAMNLWSTPDASINILIEGCVIDSNKATLVGGGISFNASSSSFYARVQHSHITHNESPDGAAIDQYHFLPGVSPPGEAGISFDNCLIAGNTSNNPVISIDEMPGLELVNCTVAHNNGGGIELSNSSGLTLQNSIFFNPNFQEYNAITNDINFISLGGNLIGDLSLDGSLTSTDKQNLDPIFVAPGDYRLTEGSPCIDMGINDGVTAPFDLEGNPRIAGGTVDMGTYEYFVSSSREALAGEVTVSPNPTSDFLNIQLPDNTVSLDVEVFDVQGKLQYRQSLTAWQTLDVQGLAPGIYSIKAVVGGRVFAGRFVKQY